MNADTVHVWVIVLGTALVLGTIVGAILLARILRSLRLLIGEAKRIADAGGKIADANQRAYQASLAPAVAASSDVEIVNPDTITVATTLTNEGAHPITIVSMYVECDGPGLGRRVYEETFNVSLRTHERIVLRMDIPGPQFDVVWFLVEDIAGQRHEIGAAGTKSCRPVARV